MSQETYNLWSENFSGVIRNNPLWDSYDRLMMELFRSKKKLLTVVEFGHTPRTADWQKDTCFTMQMEWMADREVAKCLSVTKGKVKDRYFPKVRTLSELEDPEDNHWMNLVLVGKIPIYTAEADLVLCHEDIPGSFDFSKLQAGALLAIKVDSRFYLDRIAETLGPKLSYEGFKQIHSGSLIIWKKTG